MNTLTRAAVETLTQVHERVEQLCLPGDMEDYSAALKVAAPLASARNQDEGTTDTNWYFDAPQSTGLAHASVRTYHHRPCARADVTLPAIVTEGE